MIGVVQAPHHTTVVVEQRWGGVQDALFSRSSQIVFLLSGSICFSGKFGQVQLILQQVQNSLLFTFFGETVFQKPFERLHQSRESITAGLYIEAEPRGNPKEKKKVKLPRSKSKK